jgi:membrane-associated phospholipid phosphatase
MRGWLESLVPWGTEAIVWAQSFSNEWIDAGSMFFSFLGYEQFYLFVLPFVYWCLNRRIGVGLGYVSLLSAWVNSALKYILFIPRPDDPRIRVLWPDPALSFPSGHAQNAVVNWGYLAVRFRSHIFRVVAIIAMVGIGLSRVMVGVHFPQDVIGGWLIGLIILAVYLWAEPRVGRWVARQRTAVQVVLAVAVPVALMLVHPAEPGGLYPGKGAVIPMSALVGLGIGAIMERAWVRFRVEGAWWRRGLRLLVGLLVVGVLYFGTGVLIPDGLPHGAEMSWRFVRYAILVWAVAFLVPWLSVRLRLAEREDG